MQKKVLIVDDSALMRRVLSDIINLDNRFHVSKYATNGLEALDILVQNNDKFDAIILDINMPKMSGLELLEQLEHNKIKATVIIVSTVAKEGAKETIRALELGAFDFVTKPDSFLDVKSEKFSKKIIDCLVVATKVNVVTENISIPMTTIREKNVSSFEEIHTNQTIKDRYLNKSNNGKRLVAIACSTGGPKALQRVIPLLTEDLNCSVLIVQHMPEGFTYSLAHRLNEMSKIEVKESEHGETIKNGVAYIAKGGSQMRLVESENKQQQLAVTVENARNGLKPCADIMFESLVNTNFSDIICVVLTGMGGDGTSGIKQLKEKKNIYVIAQDEATCTVYGMPKVVTEAGLVDEIVPIDGIAGAILKNLGVR